MVFKDFTKCNVLIYDEDGNPLVNARIWEHNDRENYIVVQDWPELKGVDRCRLLIMATPSPYSYMGVIRKKGLDKLINLFEEQVAENRKEQRFKTDLEGGIESLYYDGKAYPLHTKTEVRIVNISKNGMRLTAKENTFGMNDQFSVFVKIGENDKLLLGKVVNVRDTPPDAEYGCLLVRKEGEAH
jgi:hypothetical protein